MTKSELINIVIARIEERFHGSMVVWSHEGYPEQKSDAPKAQVFEAYGISEDDYMGFVSFVRELKRTVARPNGYSIMVHDLTMQETRKYRWQRYQEELSRRMTKAYLCAIPRVRSVTQKRYVNMSIGYDIGRATQFAADIDFLQCFRNMLVSRFLSTKSIARIPANHIECALSINLNKSLEPWLKCIDHKSVLSGSGWDLPGSNSRIEPATSMEAVTA